jgi:hypothetical protein
MDLSETGWVRMYWIDLAQDKDQWRVFVNTVMNLQVLEKLSEWRLLVSMEIDVGSPAGLVHPGVCVYDESRF